MKELLKVIFGRSTVNWVETRTKLSFVDTFASWISVLFGLGKALEEFFYFRRYQHSEADIILFQFWLVGMHEQLITITKSGPAQPTGCSCE